MRTVRICLAFALAALASDAALGEQFSVALFTKTAGWHHESINAGVTAIQKLGELHHFDVFWTEDANLIFKDEHLAKFKAVVFLLTTGDVLDAAQQAAFERYVRAGGGYVGVHSASDTEYDWAWYTKMLGHMFVKHPAVQTAMLRVERRDFPGLERFPDRFLFTEEWYEFDATRSPNLKYLLSVDEATYEPTKLPSDVKPNASHPISWIHEYDGGRAFYTALGHLPATYADAHFMHHVYGGIYWAATGKGVAQ
jgi:type 1 glutamine amidotransferase